MIPVSEAEKIILNTAKPLPVETCALKQAHGRILREDIKSDRDQPPFNKSLMDGITIAYSAWKQGAHTFEIEGVIAAGDSPKILKKKISCLRIMTGAVLPKNCDCIVPVEQCIVEGNQVRLKEGVDIKPGQMIRPKGADAKKGDVLLSKGTRLDPPHIGVAVSAGKKLLKVSKQPTIAIIATGDELVDLDKAVKPYQTRLSNSYALQSLFIQSGLAHADMIHLPDNKNILVSKIHRILEKYDIVVLSGGVSMGEFDYVPQVLTNLGVKQLFHKVAQKPGKPFWFGITKSGKPVFALPGNPVSTIVCAYRYVMPYLRKASCMSFPNAFVGNLDMAGLPIKTFGSGNPLTYFIPVRIQQKGSIICASSVNSGGSGDFSALVNADGFIEYDSRIKQSIWPYFSWRP
jgi:molybdopterin molybdotransferase